MPALRVPSTGPISITDFPFTLRSLDHWRAYGESDLFKELADGFSQATGGNNDSLGWTEEIARYLLILLGFIGSITCIRKNSHISLEFFYRYIPRRSIKPLVVLVDASVSAFFAYAGFLAIELAERTSAQMMVSVQIPKAVIYYTVVAACFAMAVFGVIRLVHILRSPSEQIATEKLEHAI